GYGARSTARTAGKRRALGAKALIFVWPSHPAFLLIRNVADGHEADVSRCQPHGRQKWQGRHPVHCRRRCCGSAQLPYLPYSAIVQSSQPITSDEDRTPWQMISLTSRSQYFAIYSRAPAQICGRTREQFLTSSSRRNLSSLSVTIQRNFNSQTRLITFSLSVAWASAAASRRGTARSK